MFSKAFQKDIEEAFEYFKQKQLKDLAPEKAAEVAAQFENVTAYKWAATLLSQPIYDLLKEKRINEDE